MLLKRWPELKASDDNSFLMPAEVRHVQGAGVDFGTEDGDNHSMAGDTRPMSTPRLSTRLSGGNGDMSSVGLLATIPQQYCRFWIMMLLIKNLIKSQK